MQGHQHLAYCSDIALLGQSHQHHAQYRQGPMVGFNDFYHLANLPDLA